MSNGNLKQVFEPRLTANLLAHRDDRSSKLARNEIVMSSNTPNIKKAKPKTSRSASLPMLIHSPDNFPLIISHVTPLAVIYLSNR